MNQILVTGNEGEKKERKAKKVKKQKAPKAEKQLIGIRPLVTFYAISMIILGICLISGSVYAKTKINETVLANTKPVLNVTKNDDTNTLDIQVSHIRGISKIEYKWNEEKGKTIEGEGQKELKETIPLRGGENTFTVTVTEENGQTVSYKNTYDINIPSIELIAVSNGVKINSSSKEGIKNMTYNWDGGEEKTIKVNEKEYEGIINAPEGKHTLHIEVTDKQGETAILEQVVVGDKAPTVAIKAALIEGKKCFVIDVEDDTEISKVEITLNGKTVDSVEVNDTTYHKEIEILEGENRLIVTAYNLNELETQKGAKYNNE